MVTADRSEARNRCSIYNLTSATIKQTKFSLLKKFFEINKIINKRTLTLTLTYKSIIFARRKKLEAMNTKLTLRLRKNTIEKAKKYAHNHKISLSKMIETYLESITSTNKKETEITPLVESLSGVIELEQDFDYKKEYSNYLTEKYK